MALLLGAVLANVLSVVPNAAPSGAAEIDVSESVVAGVNATSPSDVGTAASLVAAGIGDAMVFAESAASLGTGAAGDLTAQ